MGELYLSIPACWQHLEPHLAEVGVERKRLPAAQSRHHDETQAVDEAVVLVLVLLRQFPRRILIRRAWSKISQDSALANVLARRHCMAVVGVAVAPMAVVPAEVCVDLRENEIRGHEMHAERPDPVRREEIRRRFMMAVARIE